MALLYKERITLNFWRLFLRLADDHTILFRLRAVGLDHQALEFFGRNPILDEAISSAYERLEKVLCLRCRAGTPVEL